MACLSPERVAFARKHFARSKEAWPTLEWPHSSMIRDRREQRPVTRGVTGHVVRRDDILNPGSMLASDGLPVGTTGERWIRPCPSLPGQHSPSSKARLPGAAPESVPGPDRCPVSGNAIPQSQSGSMFRQPLGARAVIGRHRTGPECDPRGRVGAWRFLGHFQPHADILHVEQLHDGLSQDTDIVDEHLTHLGAGSRARRRAGRDRPSPAHAQRLAPTGLSPHRQCQGSIKVALHHGQRHLRARVPRDQRLLADVPVWCCRIFRTARRDS